MKRRRLLLLLIGVGVIFIGGSLTRRSKPHGMDLVSFENVSEEVDDEEEEGFLEDAEEEDFSGFVEEEDLGYEEISEDPEELDENSLGVSDEDSSEEPESTKPSDIPADAGDEELEFDDFFFSMLVLHIVTGADLNNDEATHVSASFYNSINRSAEPYAALNGVNSFNNVSGDLDNRLVSIETQDGTEYTVTVGFDDGVINDLTFE